MMIQNYRGIKPAEIITVLEGDGEKIPFDTTQYVIGYENVAGITRMITLGKLVPLTEEEKDWFNK